MADGGLVPSPEEEIRRKNAIEQLKQIVIEWIKSVTHKHQLHRQHITDASATVLTYGSYGLGVYNSESDIDALCVGPCFATLANVDILNPFFLSNIDETSWRSLSGVHANKMHSSASPEHGGIQITAAMC